MTTEEIAKLTPLEKRILLAKLRGWTEIDEVFEEGVAPWGISPGKRPSYSKLPNYLYDLNAIHKFQNHMTPKQWLAYIQALVNHHAAKDWDTYHVIAVRSSTAEQCVDALLQVLAV